MTQRTKASYEFKRTIATYGYLRSVSWIAFRRASQRKEGRFYDLMSSMLFCGFTLEAFLNHVGAIKVPGWSELERSLGPRDKLTRVVREVDPTIDLRKRPFSSFVEIFRFRDKLVHGKTITLVVRGIALSGFFLSQLRTSLIMDYGFPLDRPPSGLFEMLRFAVDTQPLLFVRTSLTILIMSVFLLTLAVGTGAIVAFLRSRPHHVSAIAPPGA